MIGKHVPRDELEKLLAEEKRKDDHVKELNRELMALKPGECLVYETREGAESALELSLGLVHGEHLKLIVRPGKVYAYKEK